MTKTLTFGLDGEMSGPDLEKGHVLIQVGAAAETIDGVETFSSLLNVQPRSQNWWDENAAKIHGFNIQDIDRAPGSADVDEQFYIWLLEHGATKGRRHVIPVGFNVVGFDMPFVRATLPKSSSLISRRGIDLNAICYLLEGWDPNANITKPRSFAGWKRSAKKAVETQVKTICENLEAHDAGFDAVQALLVYGWLKSQVGKSMQPARKTPRRTLSSNLVTNLGLTNFQARKLEDALFNNGVENPGKWLNYKNLDGSTGFELIKNGKFDEVLKKLETKPE